MNITEVASLLLYIIPPNEANNKINIHDYKDILKKYASNFSLIDKLKSNTSCSIC